MSCARVELELVGWGYECESWSLDYRVIFGDPAGRTLWDDLDRALIEMEPAAVCVDSGGHYSQAVYKFCADRSRRRVRAIKGYGGAGRLVWPKKATRVGKGAV